MKAVTFQAPGEVKVEDVPGPGLEAADDAIVRVEATGICGSDLHIYHGRVKIEPGDRVLGTYGTACGGCFFCRRGEYHKCDDGRVFGHGATLGSLPGAQAELLAVPHANLTLRRVPDGVSDDAALFAGDVAGTAYHAIAEGGLEPGGTVAVLGLGPVGLCAVQVARAAGASLVVAVDTVDERLRMAESLGGTPVHLTDDDPRATVKKLTEGRGVDLSVDAVGHPDALDLACRLARKAGSVSVTGVYAEPAEVHLGVVWIKALTLRTGHANVIGHLDRVLAMIASGVLDPTPLVTHHMTLDEAPDAYAVYDRREALKIVLTP